MVSLFTRFQDSSEKSRTGNDWNIYRYTVHCKFKGPYLTLFDSFWYGRMFTFAQFWREWVCVSYSMSIQHHSNLVYDHHFQTSLEVNKRSSSSIYHPPFTIIYLHLPSSILLSAVIYHHLPSTRIPHCRPSGGSERSHSELCDTRPFTFRAFRCIWAVD